MGAQRWILHADMDAFFAAVEQRERPELRGKPVIIGAGSPRGVVAAASYEARRFGVRSAMPGFRARQLCPHGVYLPGRMDLYVAVSREVREVFYEFTPEVEPLALDEAFLDVSGSMQLFGQPRELAVELKRRVRERTQLAISVGVGPNKLVAKLACTRGKPDGLLIVSHEEAETWLAPHPLRCLWGVGPVIAERLVGAGFDDIGSIARAPLSVLSSVLGARAEHYRRLARAIDESAVESERRAKSIGEENTFEHDVLERELVTAALTAHAEAVAARARRAGVRGGTITLKMKLGRKVRHRAGRTTDEEPIYPVLQRSLTLEHATDDGARISEVAIRLWDRYNVREPVRLLGVTLSNLTTGGPRQLELFGRPSDALGAALDAIEARFGKGMVRRAVDAPNKVTLSLTKRD